MNEAYEEGYLDGAKDRHTQIMMIFAAAEDKFCCSFGDDGCLHGMYKHLRKQVAHLVPTFDLQGEYERGYSWGEAGWKAKVLWIFDRMGKNLEGAPKEGCGKGVHSVLKRDIVEVYNSRGEE